MDRASPRHIGWKAGAALVALSILVGLLAGWVITRLGY